MSDLEPGPRSLRSTFASVVLAADLLVIAFAALAARPQLPGSAIALAAGLTGLVCLVSLQLVGRRLGDLGGWLVQLALLLSGYWFGAMWVIGAVFLGLWWVALTKGGEADRITAERAGG